MHLLSPSPPVDARHNIIMWLPNFRNFEGLPRGILICHKFTWLMKRGVGGVKTSQVAMHDDMYFKPRTEACFSSIHIMLITLRALPLIVNQQPRSKGSFRPGGKNRGKRDGSTHKVWVVYYHSKSISPISEYFTLLLASSWWSSIFFIMMGFICSRLLNVSLEIGIVDWNG